jgi:hypothetical protein
MRTSRRSNRYDAVRASVERVPFVQVDVALARQLRRRVLAGTRRVEVGALEGAPPALGGVRRVQAGFPAHVRLIWYFRWVVIIQGIFLQMSHGLMGRHTYQTLYDTTYNHE